MTKVMISQINIQVLTSKIKILFWKNIIKLWSEITVDFINILRAAFTPIDPKSAKEAVIFALLGSTHVKSLNKYVGEI